MSYRTLDLQELVEELEDLREKKKSHEDDESVPNLDGEEKDRLAELEAFADQFSNFERYARDEQSLIHDSDFKEYAQEFAEEAGFVNDTSAWPYTCIDWEQTASELQQDYTSYEFDGDTWWGRS